MSSHCEQQQLVLSGWLDGAVDTTEALPLLDHLTRCRACRDFYLEARALDGLAAGLREPGAGEPPPEEVWRRIRAAASAEAPASRSRVPVWALRAAAVLLVGVGLALALWPSPPPPEDAPTEIEVLLGEDAETMTEDRFVELTTEVLKADRRFHRAMYRVMEQVIADTEPRESSLNEKRGPADAESAPEREGEADNSDGDIA